MVAWLARLSQQHGVRVESAEIEAAGEARPGERRSRPQGRLMRKRGTLGLTIVAGVAVFLVVLVLYLPASWFASALPPQVRCGELGGSVWHGECLGLQYQGAPLGDATWNLAPASALDRPAGR